MKNNTTSTPKKIMLFCLLALSSIGFAQHFTVTLANMMETSNTFEVDVMLIIDGTTTGVRLASCSTGINFTPAILNGGTPCSTSGCGSWVLIPGTIAPEITANGGLSPIVTYYRGPGTPHLRIAQATTASSQVNILPGTYRIGRFRFTNTVPWAVDSDPELWLSPTSTIPAAGSTNTQVGWAPYGSSNAPRTMTTYSTPALILGYTQATPLHRVMNSSLATISNESVSDIVTAYPNPFQDVFKLSMNAISSEAIQVEVYDMLGKEIEDLNVEATRMNDFTIGQNYPSGFYNLKVSQGDKTQTIRMIKQ
ncbi:T9SS type A sorting domain-containing protein [Flavobacterium sp.]|uniref:T9SS type A sorting domain-containing protein n=1 Tax=Flavobacterium sp. TaxID=239 RepID=UPI00286CAA57|nr:T9SS type A sorting domain-containing protein [Flavobacterium sp.]